MQALFANPNLNLDTKYTNLKSTIPGQIIFKYLDANTQTTVQRVCKQWRQDINENCALLFTKTAVLNLSRKRFDSSVSINAFDLAEDFNITTIMHLDEEAMSKWMTKLRINYIINDLVSFRRFNNTPIFTREFLENKIKETDQNRLILSVSKLIASLDFYSRYIVANKETISKHYKIEKIDEKIITYTHLILLGSSPNFINTLKGGSGEKNQVLTESYIKKSDHLKEIPLIEKGIAQDYLAVEQVQETDKLYEIFSHIFGKYNMTQINLLSNQSYFQMPTPMFKAFFDVLTKKITTSKLVLQISDKKIVKKELQKQPYKFKEVKIALLSEEQIAPVSDWLKSKAVKIDKLTIAIRYQYQQIELKLFNNEVKELRVVKNLCIFDNKNKKIKF